MANPPFLHPGFLLDDEKWDSMVESEETYYVSVCWEPQFYAWLCYKGFVSIAQGDILIPELQAAYAVLDYEDLHVERSVLKRVRKKEYVLRVDTRRDEVFAQVSRYHEKSSGSWLSPTYWSMFGEVWGGVEVTLAERCGKMSFFQPHTFELIDPETDELVAGEIGYMCGKIYTALTGFCSPDHPSSGKIQICATARYLQQQGVTFINLGHPPKGDQLRYKAEIGAKTIPRTTFLKKCNAAHDGKVTFAEGEHTVRGLLAKK